MAKKVVVRVSGGAQKTLDNVETVGEVKKEMGVDINYTATVNGDPADNDQELNDFEQVDLAPAAKGGAI